MDDATLRLAGQMLARDSRDVELLARLRSHAGFVSIMRFIEKDTRNWRASVLPSPEGDGVRSHAEAMELLVELLRNDANQGALMQALSEVE